MKFGIIMKRFLLILLISCFSTMSFADEEMIEKYYPIIVSKDDPSVFALVGEIDMRTSLNFKRAIREFGVPEVLLLSSGGGLVYIGLDLAMEVNRLGITTAIPEEFSCYSACSFVFLAGKERYLDGELGVHQISSEDSDLTKGQLTLADMIDVLNSFDVPAALYPPMLSTPPNEIYVVSSSEIKELGLDSRASSALPKARQAPKVTKSNLEELAMSFVFKLQELNSTSGRTSISQIVTQYENFVKYFGKTYSADEILEDKIRFFNRWPIRSYKIDTKRSSIRCNDQKRCFFLGVAVWSARSLERNAKASGEAMLEYELVYDDGSFKISSENSVVLKRN